MGKRKPYFYLKLRAEDGSEHEVKRDITDAEGMPVYLLARMINSGAPRSPTPELARLQEAVRVFAIEVQTYNLTMGKNATKPERKPPTFTYPVPAERVVEVLRNEVFCKGEKREHQAPIKRSRLAHMLGVEDKDQALFARQLQDMKLRFRQYRIAFQFYPTGWIYHREATP